MSEQSRKLLSKCAYESDKRSSKTPWRGETSEAESRRNYGELRLQRQKLLQVSIPAALAARQINDQYRPDRKRRSTEAKLRREE